MRLNYARSTTNAPAAMTAPVARAGAALFTANDAEVSAALPEAAKRSPEGVRRGAREGNSAWLGATPRHADGRRVSGESGSV